jgi:signal transduction histidine kinase
MNTKINHARKLKVSTLTLFARNGVMLFLMTFFFVRSTQAQELKQYVETHRNNLEFDELEFLMSSSENDSLNFYLTITYIKNFQPTNNIEKIYFNALKPISISLEINVLEETLNDIEKISFLDNNLKLAKAYCYLRMGINYRKQKNFEEALPYYTKSFDIVNELGIEKYKLSFLLLLEMGDFYVANSLLDLALMKLHEAEKFINKSSSNLRVADCYNSIGLCYQYQKQWELSNNYFQKVILFVKNKGEKHKFWIGLASGNMGYNYIQLKQYQLSLNYLKVDYKASLVAQDFCSALNAATLSTNAYLNLNQKMEALYCLKNAENLLNLCDSNKSKQSFYKEKTNYYIAVKNYKAAFETQKLGDVFRDSIQAKKDRENILARTYKLEAEKKAQEVKFEQEYSRRKTIEFVIIFLIIGLAFYSFFRQKEKQAKRAEAHNKEIEEHAQKLEQSNLFINNLFLIIAHDLKEPSNTFQDIVGNINYLIKNKEYDSLLTIGAYAEKLSIHLSLTLENLFKWGLLEQKKLKVQKDKYNLYKVVLNLKHEVETLLDVKNLRLNITFPQDLEANIDVSILSIILRNFISNAIKFSLPNQTIIISAEETATTGLCINVSDSGLGMDEEQQKQLFELNTGNRRTTGTMGERGSGIGLLLCNQLAEFADMSITFTSEKNKGSIFTIFL